MSMCTEVHKADPFHILHPKYVSGRRYRVPKCQINLFKNFCSHFYWNFEWQGQRPM